MQADSNSGAASGPASDPWAASRAGWPGVTAEALLACLATAALAVPVGFARQLMREPFASRPTHQHETYWIVPEISFGLFDEARTR
jgi:hypothetical protein